METRGTLLTALLGLGCQSSGEAYSPEDGQMQELIVIRRCRVSKLFLSATLEVVNSTDELWLDSSLGYEDLSTSADLLGYKSQSEIKSEMSTQHSVFVENRTLAD